ncbi:hypothetical protein JOQ06_004934 [Pogonophryne albipinna]|uniref:Transport and Golgi organization protein 1 homolog n=1 Tax=Pogonophryne albipinna TaxID=1090488 RepID=A0AAD6FC25_9TELE|nr:hypothetical protein JOQ06_004934 [Pogonophryne albipinna]
MAAKHFYRQGFLLLLFNFISTAALEKRFSDLKRCADKECSMLLIRGKALKDFTGPDCRFLTFKKSETVYVYYKLSGKRPGIWAGSVGSNFGYFPDNLITVNHVYTGKEFEFPAEETDFVCFDTGFDKFDSYDVDLLLGSLPEDNDGENMGTSDQIVLAEDVQKETQPSEEEETEKNVNTPASDSLKKQAIPPTTQEVKPDAAEEKNMWTSIGEAVFSVVTGGERTAADLTSEEDDDDEDEVEDTPPTPLDAAEKAVEEEPVSVESQQEPENIEADLPIHHQVETISVDPESEDETAAIPDDTQNSDNETSEEPIEHKGEEEVDDEDFIHEADDDVENNMDEKATVTDHKLPEIDTHQDTFTEEMQSNNSDIKDDEKTVDDTRPHDIQLMTDSNSNDGELELSVEEPEIQEEDLTEELNDEKEIEKAEQKQELLEDENALSFSKSDTSDEPEAALPTVSTPEPEYSDSVMRLTLLRYHFSEEKMERFQKLLGLSHLFRVEAMFSNLDTEMEVSRLSHTGTAQDIESVLEGILEASENSILDEIEKMLDGQQAKRNYVEHTDKSSTDEETEILDDFQELAFALRQKYSTVSDSTPLASSDNDKDEHILKVKDDQPVIVEEDSIVSVPEAKSEDNLTVTDQEEKPAVSEDEPAVLEEVHRGPELSVEEDGGHFNKNKDNQLGFSASDELPKVPQATLENPLDLGLGVEVEHSPSGSLDPMEPVPEIPKEDEGVGLFSTGIVYMGCILSITKNKIAEWAIELQLS